MLPPRIIGLLGRSRVGKDTVAELLTREYMRLGYSYSTVRLAAPIKEAAKALFGFSDAQIEGNLKESPDASWGVTPRSVFQKITAVTMAEMGTDFFTRLLYRKYDSGELGEFIIIPDVRFEHDLTEIRRRGGVVVKVTRDAPEVPMHACEDNIQALEGDVSIKNNRSMEDLANVVRLVVKHNAFSQSALDKCA